MKNFSTHHLIKTFAKLFALTIVIGSFALAAFAAPPANDNFANAEIINGIQIHLVRTNVEATKKPNEPNHANNPDSKSVWFKWTAPLRNSDNQIQAIQWGIAEDIPTTGDFDGGGKFDYAVFRP